jgi:hypothetical protein
MGKLNNVYNSLIGNLKGRDLLGDPSIYRKIILRWILNE